nr:MAG TPA: hypothetical protein [Caudoviricetes sp.]
MSSIKEKIKDALHIELCFAGFSAIFTGALSLIFLLTGQFDLLACMPKVFWILFVMLSVGFWAFLLFIALAWWWM